MAAAALVAVAAGCGADDEPEQVAADGGRAEDALPFAETTPSTERVTASTATSQAPTTTTTAPPTTTTAAPTTTTTAAPPPPPTNIDPQPATSSCDPNYDPCVPDVPYDLDCGDIGHRVRVIGGDPHGFDREGDGIGCESY